MNLSRTMKKLQTAIVNKGLIIKINSNQFHSVEQNRMITSYRVCTPVLCYSMAKKKAYERDYEILNSCSIVDVVLCLSDIYKAVKQWS